MTNAQAFAIPTPAAKSAQNAQAAPSHRESADTTEISRGRLVEKAARWAIFSIF